MIFGSLFAGIGGFDLGLERAGMTCAWQVEIDERRRAVLEKHWPHVQRYADIRDCGGAAMPGNAGVSPDGGKVTILGRRHILDPVDVICGGFPCQDISLAGKGAGLEGKRSGLWSEYVRIIRELRPRYAIVENVSALLVRGFGRVLGDLAESGYDAEWDCIPAAAVGAPHRRDRVFLVAYRDGIIRERQCRPVSEDRVASYRINAGDRGQDVADASCVGDRRENDSICPGGDTSFSGGQDGKRRRRFGDSCRSGIFSDADPTGRAQQRIAVATLAEHAAAQRSSWWSAEPNVGRMAYGVPSRVDRLEGLGGAVVPAVAEYIGRLITRAEVGYDGR